MEALQRIGVKLYAEPGRAGPALKEFIPIFHRWIQDDVLAPQVLVDVADYSHMRDGPGIVLVGHEANWSIDEQDGRRGVLYCRKQPLPGPAGGRLEAVCLAALEACRLLEREPALEGRFRVRAEELRVFANDRLHAPNTPPRRARLQPAVQRLRERLYPDAEGPLEAETDPREPLAFTLRGAGGLESLLARLGTTPA